MFYLQLYPFYKQLSTKAKNRLRYCQIKYVDELRAFLANPKSMHETQGVGPKTMEEFKMLLNAIDEANNFEK